MTATAELPKDIAKNIEQALAELGIEGLLNTRTMLRDLFTTIAKQAYDQGIRDASRIKNGQKKVRKLADLHKRVAASELFTIVKHSDDLLTLVCKQKVGNSGVLNVEIYFKEQGRWMTAPAILEHQIRSLEPAATYKERADVIAVIVDMLKPGYYKDYLDGLGLLDAKP